MRVKVKNYLYQSNSKTKNSKAVWLIEEMSAVSKTINIKNTFHKQERLCSKKRMDLLFKKGASHGVYPVKLVHLDSSADFKFTAQAMFVVPKKNFKKAHDRNKLKRRMKECYRTHKNEFYKALGERKKLIAFVYYSRKAEDFDTIEKAIKKHLERMI